MVKKNAGPFRPAGAAKQTAPAAAPIPTPVPAAPVAATTQSVIKSTPVDQAMRNMAAKPPVQDFESFVNEANEADQRSAVVLPGGAIIEGYTPKQPPWAELDAENAGKAFNLLLSDAAKEALNFLVAKKSYVKARYCKNVIEAAILQEANELWEEKYGKR